MFKLKMKESILGVVMGTAITMVVCLLSNPAPALSRQSGPIHSKYIGNRFIEVEDAGSVSGMNQDERAHILLDTDTGVEYIMMTGQNGGLSPLLDSKGRPVVLHKEKQGVPDQGGMSGWQD